MTTTNIIILVTSILLFIVVLLIVIFSVVKNKFKEINRILEDTNVSIMDNLKNKYDTIVRLINITETKFKIESKTFNEVKKEKLSFKSDFLLNKCYKEIVKIKEDRNKTRELKSFKELITEYNDLDLVTISLRTYYNKYVMILNNTLKKFPYNAVGKLCKIKTKHLFDGKEIEIIAE